MVDRPYNTWMFLEVTCHNVILIPHPYNESQVFTSTESICPLSQARDSLILTWPTPYRCPEATNCLQQGRDFANARLYCALRNIRNRDALQEKRLRGVVQTLVQPHKDNSPHLHYYLPLPFHCHREGI